MARRKNNMTWPTKKLGEVCQKFKRYTTNGVDPRIVGVSGLVLGSLGSIISVLSLTAGDGRQTSNFSGVDYHVALISDVGFKTGFYFLILGFVLQIIEKTHKSKNRNIESSSLLTIFLLSLVLYLFGINIISRFLFI